LLASLSGSAVAAELRGRIVERALSRSPDGEVHQTAKLRTNDGRLVLLDLGAPGGEGTIRPGDSVIATGRQEMRDGKPAFAVRAIVQQFAR
jgi:hypothetical protein